MKKEELSKFLRTLVRAEVKKAMKEIIKEEVRSAVNEVLAEQFLRTVSQKPSADRLSEVLDVVEAPQKKRQPTKAQMSEHRRKELLKKMGVDSDPAIGMFYEGTEPLTTSTDIDGDDEGVDISQFGF